MNTNTNGMTDFISEAIKQGVEREVRAAYDSYIKKLMEDLERDKDTVCAGVVLNVMSRVDMRSIDNNLVITIRKIEK